MNLVHSAKYAILALGLCAGLSACGDGNTMMMIEEFDFEKLHAANRTVCIKLNQK